MLDIPAVSALECQPIGWGLESLSGQKFVLRFLVHLHPVANPTVTSPTVGGKMRYRGRGLASHHHVMRLRKIKLPALNALSCLGGGVSLRDCNS